MVLLQIPPDCQNHAKITRTLSVSIFIRTSCLAQVKTLNYNIMDLATSLAAPDRFEVEVGGACEDLAS